MDPTDKYQKISDASKVVDLYSATEDKKQFMEQLVADGFIVKDPNLSRRTNIWEHFGVFSSTDTPEFSFGKEYGKIFSNYTVPNKLFWKNYVDKIQDYLSYLSSVRPQIAQFKDGVTDQLINNFIGSNGLSPEEIAYIQSLKGQQKADLLDQLIKNKGQKFRIGGVVGSKPQAKGITGTQSPYVITSHPTATPEEHQKLQELGLEEKYEPQSLTTPTGEQLTSEGTVNTGQQFLTNEQGQRLNTAGPIPDKPEILLKPNGEPFRPSGRLVLLGPDEKPLSTGLVTFQAEEDSNSSISKPRGGPLAKIYTSKFAQENAKQVFEEGEHQAKMGFIQGVPAIKEAAGDFGREILRQVGSVPLLSGEPKETVVYTAPQEINYTSSGGGRTSPGGRNIRIVTNVPKTIKRAKKGITGARLVASAPRQIATKNPIFWIVALIILAIVLVLFLGSDNFHINQNAALCGLPDTPCGKTPAQTVETQNTVALLKNCDNPVAQGADINCNISATYTGSGVADLQITDNVPPGTTFKSFFPNDPAIGTKNGDTITWTINNIPANTPQFFYLTYAAPNQDVWVPNTATVKIIRTSINPGGDINTPPNQDNCNGEWGPNSYFGRFPQHGNFGDPNCDFSRDALLTLLRQQDPLNADFWFNTVVKCESGYDPNAFLQASTSGLGAYGLFQMNPSGQGNGPLDAGNVVWQQQVFNAVGYENLIARQGLAWRYWACAISRW